MNFKWSTNEAVATVISFYPTNITLNKVACRYFDDVNYVLLGVDEEQHQIGIKPLSKEEIDQNLYASDCYFKLSLGKSYGRISNKGFMEMIADLIPLDFKNNSCYKFIGHYDHRQDILIIDYKEGGIL